MDRKKYGNDRFFGKDAQKMDNTWLKRSQRSKNRQLNAIKQLYSAKPPKLPAEATSDTPKVNKTRKPKAVQHAVKVRRAEEAMQIALVSWCLEQNLFVFSIPNEGKRSIYLAVILKNMGLYAGASDLFLGTPDKAGKYRGFFIELKAHGKKPRKNQLQFMQRARENGYKADYFDDLVKAKDEINNYLYKEIPT